MRQKPTRLELHRLKYRAALGRHGLLALSDLDKYEKKLISNDFFSAPYRERRLAAPYKIYAEVLASWGIMCPHPVEQVSIDHCQACGSRLFYPKINDRQTATGGS